jgi:hypothetical protein
MTNERCLNDPYFWEMMPWNEKLILEFSEVSGIPLERIRTKRREYLDRKYCLYAPHIHKSTGTIN